MRTAAKAVVLLFCLVVLRASAQTDDELLARAANDIGRNQMVADAWRVTAAIMARHEKWDAAVRAQRAVAKAVIAGRAPEPQVAEERLLLAHYAMAARDLGTASETLEELPQARRNSQLAHEIETKLAIAKRQWDVADAAIRELEQAQPSALDLRLAAALHCMNEPLSASAAAAFWRGRMLMAQNEPAAAVKQLENALREAPSFDQARVELANALHAADRSTAAFQHLVRLTETAGFSERRCPGVSVERVQFNAANIAWALENVEEAEKRYRAAIDAAAERENAFAHMAHTLVFKKASPFAALLAEAVRDPLQAAPEARNNLGYLLLEKAGAERNDGSREKVYGDAVLLFAAAARNPRYATRHFAYTGRALIDMRHGNYTDAINALRDALWLQPQYEEALDLAATLAESDTPHVSANAALLLLAAVDEALPHRVVDHYYRDVIASALVKARTGTVSEAGLQLIALHHMHENNYANARRVLRRAVDLYPQAEWPEAMLAEVDLHSGDARAANVLRALARPRDESIDWNDAVAFRRAFGALGQFGASAHVEGYVQVAEAALDALEVPHGSPRVFLFPWSKRPLLIGRVTVEGQAFPSVLVTVHTPSGSIARRTDPSGKVSLRLPPGWYVVTAQIEEQKTQQEFVQLTEGTTEIAFVLQPQSADAILVSAELPLVDTLTTVQPVKMATLEQLPVAWNRLRTFSDLAPGIFESTVSIAGAESAENRFVVDGVPVGDRPITSGTIDPAAPGGAESATYSISGIPAEFVATPLRFQTSSRPEHFAGSVRGDWWIGETAADLEPVAIPEARAAKPDERVAGMSVGGPLIAKRFWGYVSVESTRERGLTGRSLRPMPQSGSDARSSEVFGKLSVAWRRRLSQELSVSARRERQEGAIGDPPNRVFGTGSAIGRDAQVSHTRINFTTSYLNQQRFQSVLTLASSSNVSRFMPSTTAGEMQQVRNVLEQFFATGGVGFSNDRRAVRRVDGTLSARYWRTLGVFSHELSTGFEYAREDDNVRDRITGGVLIDAGPSILERFWLADGEGIASSIAESFEAKTRSAYLQDVISADDLTINVGVRWEGHAVRFPTTAKFDTSVIQPRVSASYRLDPWKFNAYYGEYSEPLGADERIAFGSSRRHVVRDAATGQQIAYGGLAMVDSDLRARRDEVITLGVGRSIGPDVAVALTAVRRSLSSDIHDFFCTPSLQRCIGNPGRGIMSTLLSLNGEPIPSPAARRRYEAVELSATGSNQEVRFGTVNWRLGYTWSRNRGNTEGPDLQSTFVTGVDPYAQPAFDFAETVPPFGPLARSREHDIRAYGILTMPMTAQNIIVVSASSSWSSGEPRARFGYSDLLGRYAYFLTGRAEEGRSPSAFNLDLLTSVESHFADVLGSIGVAFENVLNTQASLVDDQRWNVTEQPIDGGRNPTFLEPMIRQEPFRIRLYTKLTF